MVDALGSAPEVPIPAMSEAAADAQLARDNFDVAALVAKADHLFRTGDHRGAAVFYSYALKCASARGVPDERAAEAWRRAETLKGWLADRFRHHILSGLERCGFSDDEWPPRFRKAVEIMFGDRPRDLVYERFPQMPTAFFYPGLPYVNFVDAGQLAWRAALEERFHQMRAEALALLVKSADFSPYITKLSNAPQGDVYGMLENPNWSSFHFWSDRRPIEENAARCPIIFNTVVENVPLSHIGRRQVFMLSLLKAGAEIPAHSGITNVRYLCHFPLIVPDNCRFRVGEQTIEWCEGQLIAFDDSVDHDARNDSASDRLVLIFDVWNPHLDPNERAVIAALMTIVDDYC